MVIILQDLFIGKGILELIAIDAKSWCFTYQKEIDDATVIGPFKTIYTAVLPFVRFGGVAEDDQTRQVFTGVVRLGGLGGRSCGITSGRRTDLASPRKPIVAAEVVVVGCSEEDCIDGSVEIESEMAMNRIRNRSDDDAYLRIVVAEFGYAPEAGLACGLVFRRLEFQLHSVSLCNGDVRRGRSSFVWVFDGSR